MLEKYFGFNHIQDELSVVDSLLEHTRIDEEELHLLSEMILFLCEDNLEPIQTHYLKIVKIREDSNRIFENIAEEIIHADFDHQKQYDLLRLYQRIETISAMISSGAKRLSILVRVGGRLPSELHDSAKDMMSTLLQLHSEFKLALYNYQNDKKAVLKTIHSVVELESKIDDLRVQSIEKLYALANENKLLMGNFRAIENIFEHIENLSDAIEDAATSLEWLLI